MLQYDAKQCLAFAEAVFRQSERAGGGTPYAMYLIGQGQVAALMSIAHLLESIDNRLKKLEEA